MPFLPPIQQCQSTEGKCYRAIDYRTLDHHITLIGSYTNTVISVLLWWAEVPEITFGTYWLRHLMWWCGCYLHLGLVISFSKMCSLHQRNWRAVIHLEYHIIEIACSVFCLERGADLHMFQLMPLPLTVSCVSKIQIGFSFLVPAHLGSPGERAVKRVCVCVCVFSGNIANSVIIFCVKFKFV